MRLQSNWVVASSRGPKAQATLWRVRRHKASHSQITPRRRWPTNVHNSSSSSTSPSSLGARVCSSGGRVRAFFEPGADGVARHAKRPAQSPQAAPLLIGAQDHFPLRLGVGVGTRALPVLSPTSPTSVALLAVRRDAILDQTVTAAVGTGQRDLDHGLLLAKYESVQSV